MNSVTNRNHIIHYNQREAFWNSIDSWEPSSFDVLDTFIQPGYNFIDIGAWNGVLSIYAGLLGANVYSIEPDIVAFYELVENCSLNRAANITPALLAISDRSERQKINSRTVDGFGNSESSLINRDRNEIEAEVITMTLEDYFRNFSIDIDKTCLIKIDAEGGEALIIYQSAKWLRRHKPTLYISFHPAWIPNSTQMFIDILFPIYDFIHNGISINEDQFRQALTTEHQHSFVLIAKA